MNICISDAYSISTNCAHSVHICMFYAYIFFLISPIRGSVADVVKTCRSSFAEAPERQPGELWPPGETNTDTHEMKF